MDFASVNAMRRRRAAAVRMHYGAKSFAHLSASIISIIWVPNFNNASAYLDMLCAMPSAHYQGSRELRDIHKLCTKSFPKGLRSL